MYAVWQLCRHLKNMNVKEEKWGDAGPPTPVGALSEALIPAGHLETMFRPMWHHIIYICEYIDEWEKCFYFHLLLKGNRFILQPAINEREEHAPDTCDKCVMKEWRHWGGWPLWGWCRGPMLVEGDGKKWDSLYEISLGNPSDAKPHYDCGHRIKERLLLSFLLLAALKQKIWAVTSLPPQSPTSVLRERRWHREAKSFSGLHFLARTTGRACQVVRTRVSVCVVCA